VSIEHNFVDICAGDANLHNYTKFSIAKLMKYQLLLLIKLISMLSELISMPIKLQLDKKNVK